VFLIWRGWREDDFLVSGLGTEDDMEPKTILIGNDHGGYDLVPHIVKLLGEKGIPAEHVGAFSGEIVRYPYYAAKVASAV